MNLSQHFTLAEACHSDVAVRKGLDNTPDADTLETMKGTATRMEDVRALLGKPIRVHSWFRSLKVNSAVGGSQDSGHMRGGCVDFTSPEFGTPQEVCRAILDSGLEFDQLIYEGAWVHISFRDAPRRSVLTAHFGGAKTTYTQGIA